MLDNAIYYNVTLPKSHFAMELLSEMLEDASNAVSLRGTTVFFQHLIVQRKMIPMPVFLEQAPRGDMRRLSNLCVRWIFRHIGSGHCVSIRKSHFAYRWPEFTDAAQDGFTAGSPARRHDDPDHQVCVRCVFYVGIKEKSLLV